MSRCSSIRSALALALLGLLGGCALHSTATRWNGHVGPDGEPVFVLQSTYLGCRFAVLLPFFGSLDIHDMVDESTRWIEASDGSRLRMVETESNNYWYGLPPLSWVFSPVMTSVTFEYKPSAAALTKAGVDLPVAEAPAAPR